MNKFFLTLSAILLFGCASNVDVTSQQTAMTNALTEPTAEKIVETIFTKTQEQSGLFSSNGSPFISNPQILKIENGVVYYADYEAYLTNPMKKAILDFKFEHTVKFYKLDMRKVTTLRLVGRGMFNQEFLKTGNDGQQFGLYEQDGIFVNLDVKGAYKDQVIAVAKFYNQKVAIKQGIGL